MPGQQAGRLRENLREFDDGAMTYRMGPKAPGLAHPTSAFNLIEPTRPRSTRIARARSRSYQCLPLERGGTEIDQSLTTMRLRGAAIRVPRDRRSMRVFSPLHDSTEASYAH